MRRRSGLLCAVAVVTAVLGVTTHPTSAAAPGGLAFSGPVTAIPLPPTGSAKYSPGEPRLAVTSAGRVLVGAHYEPWDCVTKGPALTTAASCVWASDDGQSFRMLGGAADRLTVDIDLALPSDGVVLAATMTNLGGLAETSGAPGSLVLNGVPGTTVVRSTDGGRTWTRSLDANHAAVNDRPFFLVESPAQVLLAYTAVPGGIEAVSSQDGGATFGVPVQVTPPTMAHVLAQMGGPSADRARGQLLVPYAVSTEATCTGGNTCLDTLLAARSADHGATWVSEPIASLPAGAGVNTIYTIAADSAGEEYAVFSTGGDTTWGEHVWLSRNLPGSRGWSAPVRVDPSGTAGMMPWIVAGGPGRIALAYYATTGDPEAAGAAWRVEVATSTDAGRTFVRQPISGTAYVGRGSDHRAELWDLIALVADRRGRLHVAWTDTLGKPAPTATVIRYAFQPSGPGL